MTYMMICLACVIWSIPNAVSAPKGKIPSFFSGLNLLNQCESEEATYLICLGYVAGAVDATASGTFHYQMMSDALSRGQSEELDQLIAKTLINLMPAPCIPGENPIEQVVRVVIKHMNDNPADLHLSGAHLVHEALQEAFPCK